MAILTVVRTHMDGKPKKPWKRQERSGLLPSCCSGYRPYYHAQNVADIIGADTKDIVFTSGATETNNMAIKGIARFHKEKKKHIITTQTVCATA